MSNLNKAIELLNTVDDEHDGMAENETYAHALMGAGLLRPEPSNRFISGIFIGRDMLPTFSRNEGDEDIYIEASVREKPSDEAKRTGSSYHAWVDVELYGEDHDATFRLEVSSRWLYQAAAVFLDAADEVDKRNEKHI